MHATPQSPSGRSWTDGRWFKALAVIGLVAAVGLLVAAGVGVAVVRAGFSARPDPSAFEARIALGLRNTGIPDRYETMNSPVTADAKALHRAMEHWADHCAICHANNGSGQTSIGQNLYPRPPDMRGTRTQDLSDGQLYYIINQGVRLTGMPAWGKPGDDDNESWELVSFIRRLPSLTPEEIEAMKVMNPVPASVVKAKQDEDDFLNETDPKPGAKPHKH